MQDVFVVAAVRTAIGSFGGSLSEISLSHLATHVVKEAIARSSVALDQVHHVVMGNVVPTLPEDAYLGRVAAINAGLPHEVPAFNVNRLCGSGLQAVVSAAQSIRLGDAEVAIAAGAESMSRGPYLLSTNRWGARLGNAEVLDYVLGALHDPFGRMHMGVTAENVAKRFSITRERQDQLAVESHRRATLAISEGRFLGQIVAVPVRKKGKESNFAIDEHVRPDSSVEGLAKLKAAFEPAGTVTAGNASGLNDGAAALVLASEGAVKASSLKPLARLVGYAHAGVDPAVMGIGPVPATQMLLRRTGVNLDEIAVIEANEAFAAQACAVIEQLGLDPEKVNPNGSGISLGHPVGATGAIISVKAIYELQRIKGRYALVTMCIGGGQGIAALFERV